jgi:hypothetical protein
MSDSDVRWDALETLRDAIPDRETRALAIETLNTLEGCGLSGPDLQRSFIEAEDFPPTPVKLYCHRCGIEVAG